MMHLTDKSHFILSQCALAKKLKNPLIYIHCFKLINTVNDTDMYVLSVFSGYSILVLHISFIE